MKSWKHLKLEQRKVIANGIVRGYKLIEIAETLGYGPTGISKEVKRNRKPITIGTNLTNCKKVNRGHASYKNERFYLMTEFSYRTMSPYLVSLSYSNGVMFYVEYNGQLPNGSASTGRRLRPVINLSANVKISGGNGTAASPYIIE